MLAMDAKHQTQSEDLSPYQVNSRREVISLLRSISQHNQMINMLANQGAVAIVTSVLEVDDNTDEVIIDCAQHERVNEQLLASDNISFETALEHVRILFFANRVTECTYDGAPALKIIEKHGYIAHVKGRRQEANELKNDPKKKARRWVVEVAHSWFNRFRKLLVRYEKLDRSFLALNHLAASIMALRKINLEINIIYG